VVTENPYFYKLDEIESMDIDTEFDFMLAEYVYKKMKGIE
jgi:CMP-N-acetylneuraminic acid synthetase